MKDHTDDILRFWYFKVYFRYQSRTLGPKRCKTLWTRVLSDKQLELWPTAVRWTLEFCALSFVFSYLGVQVRFLGPLHRAVSNLPSASLKMKWPSPHKCFISSKKPLERFHLSVNNLGSLMHEWWVFYYFLLPGKFPDHLSIRLMFKLFPAYFLPNLRNAANFSRGGLQDSI